MTIRHILLILLLALPNYGNSQSLQSQLTEWAENYTRYDANIKPSTVVSCDIDNDNRSIRIVLGGGFPEQHFTPEVVERVYKDIRSFLSVTQRNYDVVVETDGRAIEDLVPNFLRKGKKDASRLLSDTYDGEPWVKNISRPYTPEKGLEGNHIALWQSHGRYYRLEKDDWYWQRPRLFCTTEDLFSQTFVVPFIIPMLQNAGAVVFTPRERDYQTYEVIVDNDQPHKGGTYLESFRRKQKSIKWQTTNEHGFAQYKEVYESCDSPFTDGSARYVPTVSSPKEEGLAQWIPNIPEEGKYAVYVTYPTRQDAVDDATYTVYHKGGTTQFKVNQQMGGGTWVYLGTFEFDEGEHNYGMVSLSNHSRHKGVVSADAVRFGGGMGNIVPEGHNGRVQPSGLPRWAEAAKYSVQWYGFPYKIHTEPFGNNDYNNDINARSAAINYLSGGSIYNPKREDGLRVPLDISVAFHTDAGVKTDDAFVGSLGVYMTDFNEGKTGAGMDRYVSRDLISMFLTNFTIDLKKYNWQVRQLWNRNYGEARAPMPPACILEMLSHQNFADMRMAYDPHFKFDLSRSVYKTIVKYIATLYQRDYVIQPLPVENFAITLNEQKHTATLSWSPVDDPLEPTAKPKEYVLYTRRNYQGFDSGVIVKGTSHTIELNPDEVYSFKITAVNEGGESFPSEILSCGISSQNKGTVLVVNAFTRLEGPQVINTTTTCGFDLDADPGVPYGAYTGFCGRQRYFDRSKAGSEASDGLGMSGMELEGQLMMGNTFDYPVIHGRAIMLSGNHSFTSCSEQSLLEGKVSLSDYPIIDLIYGTQKQFNSRTNTLVEQYYNNGGKVLMSAANAGCPTIGGTIAGKLPTLNSQRSTITGCGLTFDIYRGMNPESYCVPAPSVLAPSGQAFAILTYNNGNCAAIAQQQRFVRLGFPLESITDRKKLNALAKAFLTFLE
ncbi:MAG: xanthan lyase [Bacteroidaceae bacterium]|nr:xanthan lyase [Bacteroidaceae bacterium]